VRRGDLRGEEQTSTWAQRGRWSLQPRCGDIRAASSTEGRLEDWIADDPIDDNVICTAYARTHWVNPKTGKVLGADQK
jgi:hypothetical protein